MLHAINESCDSSPPSKPENLQQVDINSSPPPPPPTSPSSPSPTRPETPISTPPTSLPLTTPPTATKHCPTCTCISSPPPPSSTQYPPRSSPQPISPPQINPLQQHGIQTLQDHGITSLPSLTEIMGKAYDSGWKGGSSFVRGLVLKRLEDYDHEDSEGLENHQSSEERAEREGGDRDDVDGNGDGYNMIEGNEFEGNGGDGGDKKDYGNRDEKEAEEIKKLAAFLMSRWRWTERVGEEHIRTYYIEGRGDCEGRGD